MKRWRRNYAVQKATNKSVFIFEYYFIDSLKVYINTKDLIEDLTRLWRKITSSVAQVLPLN